MEWISGEDRSCKVDTPVALRVSISERLRPRSKPPILQYDLLFFSFIKVAIFFPLEASLDPPQLGRHRTYLPNVFYTLIYVFIARFEVSIYLLVVRGLSALLCPIISPIPNVPLF